MSTVNNAFVYMAFELLVLVIVGACVFLKLIPNDLLILALGVVIRGALGVVPAIGALNQNTQATQANTAVTAAQSSTPTLGAKG